MSAPAIIEQQGHQLSQNGMPCTVKNVLDSCECHHARYQHNADGRCRAKRGRCTCRCFAVRTPATVTPTEPPFDLRVYVADFLAGAVGDADAAAYESQDTALTALVRAIEDRFRRPLTVSERTRVMIELVAQWNARVRAARAL